jgi:hypothetical protein
VLHCGEWSERLRPYLFFTIIYATDILDSYLECRQQASVLLSSTFFFSVHVI